MPLIAVLNVNMTCPAAVLSNTNALRKITTYAVVDFLPVLGWPGPWGGTRVLYTVHGVHANQGQGGLAHMAGGLLDPGQLLGSWPCLASTRQFGLEMAGWAIIHTIR